VSIVYKCRHCGHTIGKLQQQVITTSMLGWDKLTSEEKKKMIHYQANGDVHIHAICENCEESLGQHPNYHELDFFIH